MMEPRINTHSYSHPTFDKGNKNIGWRKETLQQNGAKKNLGFYLHQTAQGMCLSI